MNITEVRIHEVNKDGLKAFASITLDGDFVVTGISIRESKNGLFVSMPSRKVGDEYRDICFPITKEARQQIVNTVMNAYTSNDEGYFPD